ncbi:unnamed protein product [Phytophthora fragariaefolia]|uniref:Unnamed protein product n=1 Tax=Phytophthora fragariaefolia TaxID=1490495 RepID=A0A9W6YN72_9STRA|nr:unnamed protein product [Phytophthora fragariaefolia]
MTRQEFLDHHFQVHGQMSDVGDSPELKPHRYRQYHIFDCAFGAPRSVDGQRGLPNRNHAWFWRDDITELYFRDMAHLQSVFSSEHVRKVVGPDGLNFSDMGTSIPWIGREAQVHVANAEPGESDVVAFYFVSLNEGTGDNVDGLVAAFREEVETHAASQVLGLIANKAPSVLPQDATNDALLSFPLTDYFGGKTMPSYALYFKLTLKSAASATAVRKVQHAFEARAEVLGVDTSESIIAFAKEGLVLDINTPFDGARQPIMPELHHHASR